MVSADICLLEIFIFRSSAEIFYREMEANATKYSIEMLENNECTSKK